ncbi:hypothetical protein EDB80DRAFT_137438 [Ilyonectria destructans]|nr:hypothetical protein EDB80DRAFT_137438 [Ilyonectria destructans]
MPHLLRRTPHGFSFVSLSFCTGSSCTARPPPPPPPPPHISHISHPTSASTVVPVPPAHSRPRSHAPTLRGSTAHGPRTIHQRVRSKANGPWLLVQTQPCISSASYYVPDQARRSTTPPAPG